MGLSCELNWRFFDITSGRTNKRQFLIYLIISLVIQIATGYYLLAKYILFVGMLRRYRDSGIGNWLGIILILVNVLPLLLWMIPTGKAIIMMSFYFASFSGNSFPYLSVLILLIFIVPLFFTSDPNPNAYGYPPIGFDIRTMHISTYPQPLIDKYKANQEINYESLEEERIKRLEERLRYQDTEKIKKEYDDIMPYEVKSRE